MLKNTERAIKMDNPEKLATLVIQYEDTEILLKVALSTIKQTFIIII
jgi:hypothetical protein